MAASRRRILQGGVASLVTAGVSSLALPRRAHASDLSLPDRLDLLYSNQFHWTQQGEPQLTIGLMEGQDVVRLSAPGGLSVLPSGDGGTAIEGGARFELRLVRGEPAEQHFAAVLEELAPTQVARIDAALSRWRDRGFDPEAHEVGTVFGVAGQVLDNRRMLVTAGRFGSEAEATRQARAWKQAHGATGKLHPIVQRRSHGSLVAIDRDTGVRIHAEGVLWFAPRGPAPITVHDVLSGTTMGHGQRSDRTYAGSVYVAIDRHGKLSVVNLVGETSLLAGLVPAEIYASAPMEALKAQAVAARGQLVGKVGTRHQGDPFLLCAEQHCQVYAGRGREHPRTTKAVADTQGVVAMRPGGMQLVDTVYSANNGGHGEHNEHAWPGEADPQLRGRPDPLLASRFAAGIDASNLAAWLGSTPASYSRPAEAAASEAYRWRATVDPASVVTALELPRAFGPVRHLEVLARGCSGRATAMRVHGDARTLDVHGELRIRRALGNLKSSMFAVEADRDPHGRFVLVGGGHGHGVGLCQHGAIGMAAAGKRVDEILAHYYANASLKKLW